ncbi:MAG: hypothetical protein O7F73_09240 [Gammaproteobacteria bacterium]|nr:hypothetical protein [Gammaproteobacteria bacterium]
MGNQYLRRYAEPEARLLAEQPPDCHYHHVLVIPAYRESATVTDRLRRLAGKVEELLIIVVLNRPDTDPDAHCNDALRQALQELAPAAGNKHPALALAHSSLHSLSASTDLLLVERPQPLPGREGVGLARKLGCDIAAGLHQAGRIRSRWLHSSDADAHLPENYFYQAELQPTAAVAITHPFVHRQPPDGLSARGSPPHGWPARGSPPDLPMTLYELRLHYYVLGLRSAGSPYAFHTLGSCLSVAVEAYQQVRGYPRRAAAEDFYLLNKVAKLGPVSTPDFPQITIDARHSGRVPFGTGPALRELASSANPLDQALFYHPHSFHALSAVLGAVPGLYDSRQPLQSLASALEQYAPALHVLERHGVEKCLQHCQKQSRNAAAFIRHFDQWFDGFRTLKLIHGLRELGWNDLNLAQSLEHPDRIWPQTDPGDCDPQALLRACQNEFGWTENPGSP